MTSVRDWAAGNGYAYRFVGDELFDLVEPELLQKIGEQKVIATDLARLRLLQQGLAEDFERVVWCDADFLVFDAAGFVLPPEPFCFGREIWVQRDERARLRVYPKLHNAFMMFCVGNSFLDFYVDTATRLLRLNEGRMPPQFIGPKLLTALHNIARFPVFEKAGMLSPAVLRDILADGGDALDLFRRESDELPAGVNLCSSLTAAEGFDETQMHAVIERLLNQGLGQAGSGSSRA